MRQPQRLPESLEGHDAVAFLLDMETHRDRAMVLGMLLGGLRAAEVRSLRLADVDMGCDGYGWWAKAAVSGSSRLRTRSSPSAPPIYVKSVRRAAQPPSASCAARPDPRSADDRGGDMPRSGDYPPD